VTVTPIAHGLYRVDTGGKSIMVAIAGPPDNRWVWVEGRVVRLESPSGGRARAGTGTHELSAPMPATVVKLMVRPGTHVTRGETVVMLEAMKMELPIRAPRDGVVAAIHCAPGDLVQPGFQLLTLDRADGLP
jgi:biotin carboxyl carrier protein